MPEPILPIDAPVAPEGAPLVGDANATPLVGDAAQPALTLEQALAEVTKLRRENAERRVKLNEFETAHQAAERAKLTKEEQLQATIADKERALTELQRTHQEAQVAYAVERAAAKLGVVDSEVASKLLDMSQIEFDADGKPKNAEKLLRDLVQAKPYLAGRTAVSATNPSLNHSQRGDFKESQMEDFTAWSKNKAEWKKAIAEGRVTRA